VCRKHTKVIGCSNQTLQSLFIFNFERITVRHHRFLIKPKFSMIYFHRYFKTIFVIQTHRGGVHIELTRQKKSTASKLTIHDFRHEDAGTYECRVEENSQSNNSNNSKENLLSPSFKDSVSFKSSHKKLLLHVWLVICQILSCQPRFDSHLEYNPPKINRLLQSRPKINSPFWVTLVTKRVWPFKRWDNKSILKGETENQFSERW